MDQSIILLTTAGCHLCENAQELLAVHADFLQLSTIDIATDDALIERYGVRIPVLRSSTGSELDWPFDAERLNAWLLDSKKAQ
ncbi:glutaredoxin family protein [Gilvimarinus polysaccharolyticus]|uniref:glutaredoxin family protein n=1 Tax=Gilvimarinus polysaccharolyticus TaxID=863921 RepID=UPI000673648D|nr:glutaredoxin family protein [Gilvimarinus polysaccharolyticus]